MKLHLLNLYLPHSEVSLTNLLEVEVITSEQYNVLAGPFNYLEKDWNIFQLTINDSCNDVITRLTDSSTTTTRTILLSDLVEHLQRTGQLPSIKPILTPLAAFQFEYKRAKDLQTYPGVWRATCYRKDEPTEYRKYRVESVRVIIDESSGEPIPCVELDLVPLTTGAVPVTVQSTSSLHTSIELN